MVITDVAVFENNIIQVMLHNISLDLPHLMNIWEALLITTITNNITSKFSSLNALIQNQKRSSINLRKVLPLTKRETAEAFEQQERTVTTERIREILDMHYHLLSISKQVNQIFEWPILITMAVNFEIVTMSAYSLVEASSNKLEITDIIDILLWCIALTAEIIFIINSFEGVAQKARTVLLLLFIILFSTSVCFRQRKRLHTFTNCGTYKPTTGKKQIVSYN